MLQSGRVGCGHGVHDQRRGALAHHSDRGHGAKITIFCDPGHQICDEMGSEGRGGSRDYVTTQWRQRGLGGNPSWAFCVLAGGVGLACTLHIFMLV